MRAELCLGCTDLAEGRISSLREHKGVEFSQCLCSVILLFISSFGGSYYVAFVFLQMQGACYNPLLACLPLLNCLSAAGCMWRSGKEKSLCTVIEDFSFI